MSKERYGQAYQKGFNLTVRFLLSRGVQQDTAHETAQAAWAKGWERREQLRDESLVVTWVNTIALNVYRRLIRREAVYPELSRLPEKTVSIDIAAMDVARILDFCRPSDRHLLEQRYVNGVTTDEMAQEQGVTKTAIRIRLLRARRDARCQVERRTLLPRTSDVLTAAACDAA